MHQVTKSKLTLCDLAGSEDVSRSGATGMALAEAKKSAAAERATAAESANQASAAKAAAAQAADAQAARTFEHHAWAP